ncbi:coniferyl alcohol acyltransferase-like [Cryptomeria japonica]|uniref:coniferyl alcohol acyltransferase-like n=1 Tax=Cryptomeria japonica TaxID=3369 RepID=UPI0027D9E7ED|nr:coniferyl alcohol acyltransferase-like [Cryptomeria japonica]
MANGEKKLEEAMQIRVVLSIKIGMIIHGFLLNEVVVFNERLEFVEGFVRDSFIEVVWHNNDRTKEGRGSCRKIEEQTKLEHGSCHPKLPPLSFFSPIGKLEHKTKTVHLTQAYAAAALSQLNLYNPDVSVQGKLVTEFGCGGIVVGCTFDHRVADAYSANMFLTSWLLVCTQKVKDTMNCEIGIVVDGRLRLKEIRVSANYFGSVLILPFAESNAYCIKRKLLCWSAALIHDAIQSASNKDNFQSLIDFVETTKQTPALAKIYCTENAMQSSGPAVLVSSGLRFPLYEADFGWAKPTFGRYHFPWGAEAGYVMPTQSPARDCSWIVYMHLPLDQ